MGIPERNISHGENQKEEVLLPGHFYAAYVFDQAETRAHEVETIIKQAQQLGYPVRYWWLSEALELQGFPDRLIVCVHHPSSSEDAGMDLYDALEEQEITWDDLEAAALDEYRYLGKQIADSRNIRWPDGACLFPQEDANE